MPFQYQKGRERDDGKTAEAEDCAAEEQAGGDIEKRLGERNRQSDQCIRSQEQRIARPLGQRHLAIGAEPMPFQDAQAMGEEECVIESGSAKDAYRAMQVDDGIENARHSHAGQKPARYRWVPTDNCPCKCLRFDKFHCSFLVRGWPHPDSSCFELEKPLDESEKHPLYTNAHAARRWNEGTQCLGLLERSKM